MISTRRFIHSPHRAILDRICLGVAVLLGSVAVAEAQSTTVNYTMSIAGLPIGSATMVMTPNGSSTSVQFSGRAGGPLDIGRMSGSAVIGKEQVTATSESGSGKSAATARLVSRGAVGNSSFSYTGTSSRGPGKIEMTMAGNRVTALEAKVPDNPQAVRVPVNESHKAGVVDPLMLLSQFIKPGGTLQPGNICGKSHAVFSGMARFNLSGSPAEERAAMQGMPEGYRAISCQVTFRPVAGHRIDKGNAAQARTANIVLATSPTRTVLWSLAVPGTFGSFALAASEIR